MRRVVRGVAVVTLLAGAALGAAPALSQTEDSRASLTVGPVRIEFGTEGPLSQTLTAFVRTPVAARLSAELFDVVLRPEGFGWRRVSFGSTTQTMKGAVEIAPAGYDVVPTGSEQEFTFTLTIDPTYADHPRFGSLLVTLTPPGSETEGEVAVAAAVGIQVVGFGPPGTSDLRLALDSLTVTQRSPWTLVDRLLPEIPGVIGHGPAIMTADGQNVGDAFLDERTVFEIRRVSPLSLLPGFSGSLPGPILRVTTRPRYTLPGQRFTDTVSSIIPLDNGSRVDALPLVGFVRVTATATGDLDGLKAEPAAISRTYLVFPWSEFLFFFVVYLAQREWRHRNGRKVNMTGTPPPPTLRARVREGGRKLLGRRVPVPTPAEPAPLDGAEPSGTPPVGQDPEHDGPEL